jgi:hypothetical protein
MSLVPSPAGGASSSADVTSRPFVRRRLATVAVLLGLVVAAFEGTVVAGAMPSITRALGGMSLYAWAFTAFLITSTLGVLVCGKLADALGRRPVFIGGMSLFLVGSLLCGLAPTAGLLIAFRAVQGLGAGAIQPIAMTITADIYTLEERARMQSVFTTAWGAASTLGPLIGGWIVTHASWRWVFLVNVPIGLLAVAMLMISYRDPPRGDRGESAMSSVLQAVWAGLVVALWLIALEPAGIDALALRIGLATTALVATLAFVRAQRSTSRPLLAAHLAKHRVVRAGLLGGLCGGALLYACSAYVPLWITQHTHRSAMAAGAALVPLLLGWALASTFGVHVLIRHGMRASVAGGFGIALLGASGMLVATHWLSSHAVTFALASLAVLGMGIGPASSTSLIAPQSSVAWSERGAITSTVYASRTLGGSLAVAILGAAHVVGDSSRAFIGVFAISVFALITTAIAAPSRSAK